MKIHPGKNRGYTIILVMICLVIVFVFTQIALNMSSQNLKFVRKEIYDAKALYAAHAGLSRGLSYLEGDNSWDGTTNGSRTFEDEEMSSGDATYTVYVYNNLSGTTDLTGPEGIIVPPGNCYIHSIGTSGGENCDITQEVGAMVQVSSQLPTDFATFGRRSVQLSGNGSIDAYDSRLGAYDDSTIEPVEGDTGTNSSEDGAITITGNSTIDGDIYVGSNSSGPTTGGKSSYTGDVIYMDGTVSMEPLEPPELEEATEPDQNVNSGTTYLEPDRKYNTISVSGHSTIVFTSGTYHITGDFSMTSQSVLQVDSSNGPVVIYCDGDITLTGQSIVQTGDNPKAENLQIYGTETCENIKFRGRTETYMVLYAPNADVSITANADIYGSYSGRTIDLKGNGDIHYDTALRDFTPGGDDSSGGSTLSRSPQVISRTRF